MKLRDFLIRIIKPEEWTNAFKGLRTNWIFQTELNKLLNGVHIENLSSCSIQNFISPISDATRKDQ